LHRGRNPQSLVNPTPVVTHYPICNSTEFSVAAGYTDGVIAYRPLLNFFFLVLVVVVIWVIARISK
jgi:hypothetical protein